MPLALPKSQLSPEAVLAKAAARAADGLGLKNSELAPILGVSAASVSRLNGGGFRLRGKSYELAAYLVRIYRALDAMVNGDRAAMRAWMQNENQHLGGIPKDEIKSVHGLIRVMNYLDAIRAPL